MASTVVRTHLEVRDGRREQQQQNLAQSRALDHLRGRFDGQDDREEEARASREREKVLNWLAPEDYAPEFHDLLRRRQPGTGQWLLDSDEFKTWCVSTYCPGDLLCILETNCHPRMAADRKAVLFCPGIPGAGKTILSTTVIDHLHAQFRNDPDVAVAYLYCNFRRHAMQKLDDLVNNLLKQLAAARPPLPAAVKALYDNKPKDTRPALDEVFAALRSVAAEYAKVYIVVDELDECTSVEDCRGRLVSNLLGLCSVANIRLFATCRPIPDVVGKFSGFPSLEIQASREDVGRYLQGHMGELMPFVARSQDLQDRIVASIADAADGM